VPLLVCLLVGCSAQLCGLWLWSWLLSAAQRARQHAIIRE
jgi:hypothetical protein